MELGEKMSEITDTDAVVEGLNGRLYASREYLLMGRPLDTARALYVHLHRTIGDRDEFHAYEVYHDHILAEYRIHIVHESGVHMVSRIPEERIQTERAPLKQMIEHTVSQFEE